MPPCCPQPPPVLPCEPFDVMEGTDYNGVLSLQNASCTDGLGVQTWNSATCPFDCLLKVTHDAAATSTIQFQRVAPGTGPITASERVYVLCNGNRVGWRNVLAPAPAPGVLPLFWFDSMTDAVPGEAEFFVKSSVKGSSDWGNAVGGCVDVDIEPAVDEPPPSASTITSSPFIVTAARTVDADGVFLPQGSVANTRYDILSAERRDRGFDMSAFSAAWWRLYVIPTPI